MNPFRVVGFYEKTIQNVKYVFIIPAVVTLVIKIVNIVTFDKGDLFSVTLSKSLDLLSYLIAIMGPLAFLVCSFSGKAYLSYFFYLLGA